MLAIFGINNPIEVAILFGIVGGIFATLRQITKAREAKQTKNSIDELQKHIGELPPDATEEQFRAVLDKWERGKWTVAAFLTNVTNLVLLPSGLHIRTIDLAPSQDDPL